MEVLVLSFSIFLFCTSTYQQRVCHIFQEPELICSDFLFDQRYLLFNVIMNYKENTKSDSVWYFCIFDVD